MCSHFSICSIGAAVRITWTEMGGRLSLGRGTVGSVAGKFCALSVFVTRKHSRERPELLVL